MFRHYRMVNRILLVVLALLLAVGPLMTVSNETPALATHDEGSNYTVDIFVVDNFKKTDYSEINGGADDNCTVNTEGSGFAIRGAAFALRGAAFAIRGAAFATRGAAFATRGAGFATRGAGFATRGAGFATRGAGFATRGAGFATRGADGELEIRKPHGKIVTWELEELDYWYGDNVDVNIVKVRVNDYRTDRIASQLRKKIRKSDADFIVINMSFAVVPCAEVETMEEYLAELADSENYDDLLALQEALDTYLTQEYDPEELLARIEDDELVNLLGEHTNRVFAVASAGNYGVEFPFFPAAWDNVISVSGSASYFDFYETETFNEADSYFPLLGYELVDAGLSDRPISNYGEIMMPGQYYDIIGASYASPRLSYLLAHYLADVGPAYCRNEQGGIGLDHGTYNNLTFEEAAEQHCEGIMDSVPEELPFDIDGDGLIPFTTYIEAEDPNLITLVGSWDEIQADFVSNDIFLSTGSNGDGDYIELDFAGPFVEVFYVDGWVDGKVRMEVDGQRRRTRRTDDDNELSLESFVLNRLDDEAHTLEIYARRGGAAVDGIFTTIMVQDPFADNDGYDDGND